VTVTREQSPLRRQLDYTYSTLEKTVSTFEVLTFSRQDETLTKQPAAQLLCESIGHQGGWRSSKRRTPFNNSLSPRCRAIPPLFAGRLMMEQRVRERFTTWLAERDLIINQRENTNPCDLVWIGVPAPCWACTSAAAEDNEELILTYCRLWSPGQV
jgi:hypothetical protein